MSDINLGALIEQHGNMTIYQHGVTLTHTGVSLALHFGGYDFGAAYNDGNIDLLFGASGSTFPIINSAAGAAFALDNDGNIYVGADVPLVIRNLPVTVGGGMVYYANGLQGNYVQVGVSLPEATGLSDLLGATFQISGTTSTGYDSLVINDDGSYHTSVLVYRANEPATVLNVYYDAQGREADRVETDFSPEAAMLFAFGFDAE
jgi:hypothetical protein